MISLATLFMECLVLLPAAALALSDDQAPASDATGVEFFEKKVRPVLVEHCYACHSSARQKSGLRLDTSSFVLQGGDRGPAIVPGDPEKSRLIQAVRYMDENVRMPPKGKLKDEQIADLTTWVKMGAPAPKDEPTSTAAPTAEFDLEKRRAEHWAWQPVRAQPPPAVGNTVWSQRPIDQFTLARLEAAGLKPSAPADKRTLIRRVFFDLIGLPPTPQAVESFLADDSRDAFEKVVAGLLASEHFGERWARHWLDLVRYAEARGHEFDHIIPNAYQYRDYVIRALNADVPYDRFVTEHIAGDLVEQPRLHPKEGFNESVLGTGFWFLGEEVHSPVDIRGDETDRIDNKIDVFSKTFLGLTVSCARCHDHKFDAISQQDYYALAGFLISSSYRQVPFESMEQNQRVACELEALRDESRRAIVRAVAEALSPSVNQLAEYLLAAREAIAAESRAAPRDREVGSSVAEIAAWFELDTVRLARWVEHLRKAREDRDDPFRLWSVLAADGTAPDAQRIQAALVPIVDEFRKRSALAEAGMKGARVIVDYRTPRDDDWLVDGPGFGSRPTRPGDVRFSADPERPIAEVFHHAAARQDPAWNELAPAPGTENDPGKVAWSQAGRTLHTRTFTLESGRLYFLVQGSGNAYAAVDSHRLIAGPLHGSLVRSWDASGDKPHWIEQNLSDYKGHRLHIEFSLKATDSNKPATSSGLAVLMVVEADTPPAEFPVPNATLLERLAAATLESSDKLARLYEQVFLQAIELLRSDQFATMAESEGWACLANWVFQHPDLFELTPDDARHVAAVARPFMEKLAALQAQIHRVSHNAPALLDGSGVDEFVLRRGNHRTPGEVAPRRFLEAIHQSVARPESAKGVAVVASSRAASTPFADSGRATHFGSGRFELARQVTDPANPLVARVMVNRTWHHLFGRGIVASVDNLGVLGERPTHPELLDYLSGRFVEQGWSIKSLIREIVLSSTYQMSSRSDPQADAADPQNFLLHHKPVRRLEGEVIRDAILAVSGRLDRTMFGPSVDVYLTPFMEGRGRPAASGPLDGAGRRSIYQRVRRNFPNPMLTAFDLPTPFSTIGRRSVSNVPAQALALMNSPFVVEQAKLWAGNVLSRANRSDAERVTEMYESAFGRPPTPDELAEASTFLDGQAKQYSCSTDDPRVWSDLGHVLLNVKEFVFIR